MNSKLIPITLFCFGAALAQTSQTVQVTVYPYAGNGPANLVSNALPLKPGTLRDARNVRVLDGTAEVPVATRVLATWPQDGSIRSLLLQFNAAFTTASKAYSIAIGSPRVTVDPPFMTVSWDLPQRIFTLPAAYLSDSLIFWEQRPLGQTGFPAWDSKQLNYFSRISTVGTSTCSDDDQYYDSTTSSYQLYARSGNLQHLTTARRWALHHRRDQIYLSGSSIGRARCSGGYVNNTRYTYPQGLISDYMMFGDEEAKRVAALVVDNFYMNHEDSWYYKAPNTRGFWTEREAAFALIGILSQYEATGNAAYINEAKRRITMLHKMQVDNARRAWVHNLYDHDPSEGCRVTDWGSSPWMSGLLLEAVVKYHKITGDVIGRESVLMAVDDLMARYVATGDYAGRSFIYLGCPASLPDGTPDLDNLISHALGYAYKLTGQARYRDLGTAVFNTAVADGFAGAPKQYNQQFRSSGHFVAYISTAPTPDSTNPTTSVTSPTAAQSVSGTITATASASDNVGIAGVQFLIDGAAYGAEDTTAPYSVSINTTTLTNGNHTIASRARDAAGNVATSAAVTFSVSNNGDTTAPTVAITAPTAGQTISGTVALSASASDAVGVSGVQFLVDGANYGAEDTTAPYGVSLNTTTLSNGGHTVSARARDAAGNVRTSTAVSVTVSNSTSDTTPPNVSITSPTSGQTVSGTINLTASASDNVGVTNVQFLVDGSNYGALDTVAPYSVSLNTGALTNGSHTVQARARDAAGNVRTSSLVTFNVSNVTAADTTPPNVAVTSPTSGQTVSGTINAAATASDNVGVAGVRFLIDGAQQGSEDTAAPYTASINTTALTNGNHTITARARDAAGNVRTSTAVTFAVSNSSSGTDSTPPNVTLTSPANGSTISGLVVATASATDNVRVVGVQFLIDGKAYGAEDRAAPFNATIHTSLLTTGAHTIAATARDAAGNRRTAQVSVNVSNSTFTTLRLNTGGSDWRDATGNTWLADAGYVGGTIYRTGAQISGENEPLYKDQRNGSPSFRYNFYVPNGTYRVKLGFAEINWMISGPGQRLFHVHINGARVLTYFDVWAVSGGNNYHHDVVIPVTVGNGTIQISFDSAKSDAIVSAIQIERQ